MENLPEEVLSDIFIRLSAKQLAQMRCVCKSWNALLSESSFIKSHLHRSIRHNDQILLFSHIMFSFEHSSTPFTARLSHSPDLELAHFIKPPVIPQIKYGYGFLIGSVNGLICFCYKSPRSGHVLHIWNPSLSAFLTLPPSSFPSWFLLFGFGFDPKSDDYKIVKLTSFSRAPYKVAHGEVYSMRKGSWNLISHQTFPSHITILGDLKNQVCVDDHLHRLCETYLDRKRETILAFDLGSETFREIPLPETILDFKVCKPSNVLGVLCGKLCVISCVKGGKSEVWVKNEYGVPESWVKHHAFSQFSGYIIPYGFTSHGEFLFRVGKGDDRFGLYDPVAANTKNFKIMSIYYSVNKFVEYVDSLIWIQPANHEISGCNMSQLEIGK